jgi:adenylate cyclase
MADSSAPPQTENEAVWRALLTGEHPALRRKRWLFRRLPRRSSVRCKTCLAPFTGPLAPFVQLFGIRPWNKNPRWCNICEEFTRTHPGGAEVEVTLVFADIRGSTTLAERMAPTEFRELLQRFYGIATRGFIGTDAIVDKLVGDEVIALYLPAFAGSDCTRRAVGAAQQLLVATGHGPDRAPWLPVGIGLHAGRAYVGSVGSTEGVVDFTALGDTVNIAARLASEAGAGEILISEVASREARLGTPEKERRQLDLRGHAEPIEVHVLHSDSPLGRSMSAPSLSA